jgi:peptidoglycan/LPS O-acetylase OafA/YrhL
LKINPEYKNNNQFIDSLRALSVIFVINYHYFPSISQNGYLGVDIFFVISGFVITKSITEKNLFSVSRIIFFYRKRILRLFPSIVVVILLFLFLFVLFVSRPGYEVFQTAKYSIVGLSNIYLFYINQDYFSINNELNPFSHIWSLSVEEQFYLIYPLVVFFFLSNKHIKNYFNNFLVLFFFISLFSYLLLKSSHSLLTFYLTPFRIWQIIAGAIAYRFFKNLSFLKRKEIFFFVFFLLTSIFFIKFDKNIEFFLSSIVTIFTFVILINLYQLTKTPKIINMFSYIGKLSFSLYLFHWPILVLLSYTFGHSNAALFLGIIFTFLLSILNYNFIENKFRYKYFKKVKNLKFFCVFFIIIVVVLIVINLTKKIRKEESYFLSNLFNIEKPEKKYTFSAKCYNQNTITDKNNIEYCFEGIKKNTKKIFLFGDSHAEDYAFIFNELSINNEFDFFLYRKENEDFPFSLFDNNFDIDNSKILNFLSEYLNKEDIFIFTFHRGRLNDKRDSHVSLNIQKEDLIDIHTKNFENNIEKLVLFLKEKSIKIILIHDTPLLNRIIAVESCMVQNKFFNKNSCTISKEQDYHTRYRQDYVFQNIFLKNINNVYLIDPLNIIYEDNVEFNPIDKNFNYLMNDWHHISKKTQIKLEKVLKIQLKSILNKKNNF